MNMNEGHIILLIQPTAMVSSRSFFDYDSTSKCIEGVCSIFEANLRASKSSEGPSITYTILEILEFIDKLYDLACMVYQKPTNSYAPYGKVWIKQGIHQMLYQAGQDSLSTKEEPMQMAN